MKKRRGFTLIELLVVISIIALLMSILMPALGKAKKVAQAAICMSNLHQWGLLWKFYTDDHKGYLPDRDGMNDWPMTMWEYHWKSEAPKTLREMLLCPAAKKTIDKGGRNPYMAWYNQEDQDEWEDDFDCYWPVISSYLINLWSSSDTGSGKVGGDRQLFWRTPNVRGAAYAPIMVCAQWKDADPLPEDEPPVDPFIIWTPGEEEMRRACIQRHGDYVNAVFLDFSVRRVGLKELWELWWHQGWPEDRAAAGRPVWPDWMAGMKEYATD